MTTTDDALKEEGQEILRSLGPEEQVLFDRVILAERERLHMSSPHGVYDEIQKAVEEVIK